jgi:hypothetical protein
MRYTAKEVVMVRKLLSLAALALLALALLAGCDQLTGVEAAAIIGSINIDPNSEATFGGAGFHVLICDEDTVVDPYTLGSVDAVIPVVKLDGTFPGTGGTIWTTNYTITDVPAGTYFAFVWVDNNSNGTFERAAGDYFGFYDANAGGNALWWQPGDMPNIVVPATGLLDIDIWCGYQPPS